MDTSAFVFVLFVFKLKHRYYNCILCALLECCEFSVLIEIRLTRHFPHVKMDVNIAVCCERLMTIKVMLIQIR